MKKLILLLTVILLAVVSFSQEKLHLIKGDTFVAKQNYTVTSDSPVIKVIQKIITKKADQPIIMNFNYPEPKQDNSRYLEEGYPDQGEDYFDPVKYNYKDTPKEMPNDTTSPSWTNIILIAITGFTLLGLLILYLDKLRIRRMTLMDEHHECEYCGSKSLKEVEKSNSSSQPLIVNHFHIHGSESYSVLDASTDASAVAKTIHKHGSKRYSVNIDDEESEEEALSDDKVIEMVRKNLAEVEEEQRQNGTNNVIAPNNGL